jgi:hypothetical protein
MRRIGRRGVIGSTMRRNIRVSRRDRRETTMISKAKREAKNSSTMKRLLPKGAWQTTVLSEEEDSKTTSL